MNVSLAHWIEHYGYLAVLVATLLQGAAVLVLAGFLAHQGHLDLGGVLLAAFVGGSAGDQLLFWFGLASGPRLRERSARLARVGERIGSLVQRYDAALIVGIRFMYGLRVAGPILMGALGVSPRRFAVFNVIGAAVWAALVGGTGYLSGHALQAWLGDLQRIEILVALAVAGALVAILARRWWRARPARAPRR